MVDTGFLQPMACANASDHVKLIGQHTMVFVPGCSNCFSRFSTPPSPPDVVVASLPMLYTIIATRPDPEHLLALANTLLMPHHLVQKLFWISPFYGDRLWPWNLLADG